MLVVKQDRGFTLVELIITVAVVATLSTLGMPALTGTMNNAKVRTATEALQNGLRTAQSESIRRSHQVAFVLTNSTPGLNATPVANGAYWYIQILPVVAGETLTDAYVQGGRFGEQTAGVAITGPAVICFNSIGRLVTNASTGLGAACTAPAPTTNFDVTRTGADRTLELQVSAAGKIRMCDKSRLLSASAPDGC